jgi:hypothetical protein
MRAGDAAGIYEDLMRFRPEGLTPNAWAMKAGVSRTVWADMRRHGNPSRRTLEKLLTAAGSSLAEFEALRIGSPAVNAARSSPAVSDRPGGWGAPHLPALALVATALAGEWGDAAHGIVLTELRSGEVVDRMPRPASLANDAAAYAITIVGDSMWPRFRPGRRVAVTPKSPVAVGDDVLVKLKRQDRHGETVFVLIGELVRRSGSAAELRQFNPATAFEVASDEIAAIERIAGELI